MTPLILASGFLFAAGLGQLLYAYWGYGALLRLLASRKPAPLRPVMEDEPARVTVLLTVFNEERNIMERLANLAELDYPPDRYDILVCSDGSTDGTESLVASFKSSCQLRVVTTQRVGKSAAQNFAMTQATGEIVVLSDAEARFDRGFLNAISACFRDDRVGCATAHLRFVERSGAIAQNQGRYWSYELMLREMESRLGILAVASGQAMAFRRELFRPLPVFVGDDCIIPLDVAMQGKLVVHCNDALAFDVMENEASREFRTRVRMTMRNWAGTWLFPALLNPFRNPGYAMALWSHKLLRWLGWVGLTLMLVGALGLCAGGMPFAIGALFLIGSATAVGGWAEGRGTRIPIAGTLYSFVLANVAFMVGVVRAIFGNRIVAYRSGSLKANS